MNKKVKSKKKLRRMATINGTKNFCGGKLTNVFSQTYPSDTKQKKVTMENPYGNKK